MGNFRPVGSVDHLKMSICGQLEVCQACWPLPKIKILPNSIHYHELRQSYGTHVFQGLTHTEGAVGKLFVCNGLITHIDHIFHLGCPWNGSTSHVCLGVATTNLWGVECLLNVISWVWWLPISYGETVWWELLTPKQKFWEHRVHGWVRAFSFMQNHRVCSRLLPTTKTLVWITQF